MTKPEIFVSRKHTYKRGLTYKMSQILESTRCPNISAGSPITSVQSGGVWDKKSRNSEDIICNFRNFQKHTWTIQSFQYLHNSCFSNKFDSRGDSRAGVWPTQHSRTDTTNMLMLSRSRTSAEKVMGTLVNFSPQFSLSGWTPSLGREASCLAKQSKVSMPSKANCTNLHTAH